MSSWKSVRGRGQGARVDEKSLWTELLWLLLVAGFLTVAVLFGLTR